MQKRIFSVLTIAISLCIFTVTQAFAHTATIVPDDRDSYKAVRLTPEIYNKANADLSDLLVQDKEGVNVPYFIHSCIKKETESRETYAMELINAYEKDSSYYFDYKLAVERDADVIATSLVFTTKNEGFAKDIELYGSYDNINWEHVQRDKLYVVDAVSKLQITLQRPQKYTHYRLKLNNNLERISFDTVELVHSIKTINENYFIEQISPHYIVEHADRQTIIKIDGLKNLKLCDITIQTDSMFKRMVYAGNQASKELYHLSFDEFSYEDLTIPLDGRVSADEEYTLTITNGDDKPVNITGITARYYADEIIFDGKAGQPYTLEFDGNSARTAPVYDITQYKSEVLNSTIDRLQLGEIQYMTEEPTPQKFDQRIILNVVVVGVAILLGVIILLKLKQK